ncbi:MAG: hypothetical protein IT374_17420 [Polyangiaceae bacterium]|nr:hypothetical protein [Polyangiaceae bacterium]
MSEGDSAEFVRILVRRRACSRIVGGYAMAHHGLPRATNDVDVLVATDERNRARVRAAAAHVDVTTKIDGVGSFDRAYARRSVGTFFGHRVGYLSLDDMLRTKRAANRPKDWGDAFLVAERARRRR